MKLHYPERRGFFRDFLRLQDASLQTLVDEAKTIMPVDSKAWIAELFVDISRSLRVASDYSVVQPLCNYCIFPIITGNAAAGFDLLLTARDSDVWFIADRPHLKQSFEGMVPLLAFNIETVEAIKELIELLSLKNRVLSKVAKGVSKPNGQFFLHEEYTKSLRQKSRCIARYEKTLLFLPP
jgi:hypothetical protein